MDIGGLFWIEQTDASLEEKVLRAADSYQKKYGQAPTLCLLHPSMLKGSSTRLGRLRLEAKKSILPNYLWIGIGADTAKPLAS